MQAGGHPTPREIEIKLLLRRRDVTRLRRHPMLWPGFEQAGSAARLDSVYFDDRRRTLRKNGLSLRVRQVGDRQVQTIKSRNGQAAPIERGEWEAEVPNSRPDLRAAAGTPLQPILSKLRDPLEPVFETRVTRTSFPVQYGNSEIQLALDEGEIDTGEAKEPICELELELKRGAAGDLFGLAQMLDGKIPLQLSYAAKSGRGYALLDGAVSDLVKARDPDLQPGMSCAEVFRLLAHECLRHLVENRAGVIRGEPDALHQVRIATRRFATVLTLFRDLVPGLGAKAVKRQLHWLRDQTGAARDLDVFLVEVVAPLRQQFPRDKAVGEFYRRLRKRRTEAYRTARGAIRSPEFRRLVVEAAGWIESGDWREEADALMRARQDAPIEIYAAQRLSDLRRKVRKRGKAMRKLNERSRHKLRVHGKKLRYAAEFFMSLAGSKKDRKRARELIDVMQRLQDKLGGLNDIAVRRSLSAEVAGAPSKGRRQNGHDRNFVVGLVAGHPEARAEGLLREAEEAIADFRKVKPFWKDWSTQPALAAASAAPDGPTAEPEIPASDSQRAAA